MNKHVAKLQKDASEARKAIEYSDSDSSDSEDESRGRRKNKPAEKPTEDQVEKLEDKLEAAQADQKNLFLIIFQRFIMILSEHLVRCDTDAVDFKTPWFYWTVGRLHQIFMLHHEQVYYRKLFKRMEGVRLTWMVSRHCPIYVCLIKHISSGM